MDPIKYIQNNCIVNIINFLVKLFLKKVLDYFCFATNQNICYHVGMRVTLASTTCSVRSKSVAFHSLTYCYTRYWYCCTNKSQLGHFSKYFQWKLSLFVKVACVRRNFIFHKIPNCVLEHLMFIAKWIFQHLFSSSCAKLNY